MSHKVLVIEDQKDIAELIALHLADIDCQTRIESDGAAGLAAARATEFDLIVLDLMLPGENGLDICRQIRASWPRTRIVMLTARASELDRVLGLEVGADDYVTKPFGVLELVARVKAQLRRLRSDALQDVLTRATIRAGEMVIEPKRRMVLVGGREIELTAMEFNLLLHLASDPGRVWSRAQLLDAVWGYSHAGYEHTVNAHINRLRNKIELDATKPLYIRTVWGVGYKFAEISETGKTPLGARP